MKKKILRLIGYVSVFLVLSLGIAFFRGGREDISSFAIQSAKKEFAEGKFENAPRVYYFWATWCGACKLNLPFVKFSHRILKDRMIFLSIEEGESKEELEKYIAQNHIEFAVISGNPDLLKKFSVSAFPTTLFINRKNEVLFSDSGILNPVSFFLRILVLYLF